jgi:hypothetical protein
MFQVIWERGALDHVGARWAAAEGAERLGIGNAFIRMTQQLRTDPYAQSESRPDGRRIMLDAPLGIRFSVDDDSQTVQVEELWVFPKRHRPENS